MGSDNLKNQTILILGAKGMLGQDLALILADYSPILWDKTDLDLLEQNQLEAKINQLNPQIIINCAAYTAVDDCEINKDLALQLNSHVVGYLALAAKKIGAILFHISTDYVFSGQNKLGYAEESQEFGPVNFYGQSKLLGEKTLHNIGPKYYLIRTSWLYGQNGANFVKTMLKIGADKKEVAVVNDQFGKPTYTIDLGRQILYILNNNLAYGIYHVTNETKEGGISWFEFAQKIFQLADLKITVFPCTSSQFPRPAQRPAHSALINSKLPPLRSWEEGLKDYLK